MDDVASVIKACGARRSDGVLIPTRAPQGWVHLSVATAKIAHALLGGPDETWADAFKAVTQMGIDAAGSPGEAGENDIAEQAGEYLVEQMVAICRNATLATGYRPIGGAGLVETIPAVLWDCEDYDLRFRTWSFDPSDPGSRKINLPCWIWVEAKSLEGQLERIDRWKRNRYVRGIYEGSWGDAETAIEALHDLAPDRTERLKMLVHLCSSNGCQAVAGEMVRHFNGNPAERDLHWAVPPFVWAGVNPADPRNRITASEFHAGVGLDHWHLQRVRFDLELLSVWLEDRQPSPAPDATRTAVAPPPPKGKLPSNAKPAHRKYEAAAHAVAELIRVGDVQRSAAIREVAPEYHVPSIQPASIERAIRATFDLMYSADGKPIQIDQN